jgi:hypothetical protein
MGFFKAKQYAIKMIDDDDDCSERVSESAIKNCASIDGRVPL